MENIKNQFHNMNNYVSNCNVLIGGIKEIILSEHDKNSDFSKKITLFLNNLDKNLEGIKNGLNDFSKKYNEVK